LIAAQRQTEDDHKTLNAALADLRRQHDRDLRDLYADYANGDISAASLEPRKQGIAARFKRDAARLSAQFPTRAEYSETGDAS